MQNLELTQERWPLMFRTTYRGVSLEWNCIHDEWAASWPIGMREIIKPSKSLQAIISQLEMIFNERHPMIGKTVYVRTGYTNAHGHREAVLHGLGPKGEAIVKYPDDKNNLYVMEYCIPITPEVQEMWEQRKVLAEQIRDIDNQKNPVYQAIGKIDEQLEKAFRYTHLSKGDVNELTPQQ